jgi:preprotein translocase subunit SecG
MNFLWIFIFAIIITAIALIATLLLTKDSDAAYSGNKSISNQVWIYLASIPVLALFAWIYWLVKN